MKDRRSGVWVPLLLLSGAGAVAWLATEPARRRERIQANETAAREGLHRLAAAQFARGEKSLPWWTKDIDGLGVPGIPSAGYGYRALPDPGRFFSMCAFPEVYGKTGLRTYVIDGDALWSRDLEGRCPDRAPTTPELTSWSVHP